MRLDSSACLIRASSTCKRWRRVVAGVGFLCRFRSVHGPPIAGTYHSHSIVTLLAQPAALPGFVPLPSSGINGRHFSLDFLLDTGDIFGNSFAWTLKDTRADLVLLEHRKLAGPYPYQQVLVICEPLSRRYEVIPSPYWTPRGYRYRIEAVLLDGDDNSSMAMPDGAVTGIGLSNFKVLCVAYNNGGCEAGVFTSGGWRKISIHGQSNFRYFDLMGHSEGKIYRWVQGSMAVVVDSATADLASFVLRIRDGGVENIYDHHRATVTTGRDGEARIAICRRHYGGDMKVFAARQGVLAGGSEWVLEKTIRLPAAATPYHQWQNSNWRFRDPSPAASCQRKGTVFIEVGGWLLALDLDSETIKIETDLKLGYPLELPWPPALRACRQPGTDLGDHDS
ncbi:unnamed protein product [Urochloa decumbens]|uniref:F-box domain-containing protein n=1 Tax=Urochloa decumbens TaxID=240449 RepID=A0ABC8WB74_9POAL